MFKYMPLSLYNPNPRDPDNMVYELRNHIGEPTNEFNEDEDIEITPNSLLYFGKTNRPKLLICVTMYNEPYSQLWESLAGIYRSYYEL